MVVEKNKTFLHQIQKLLQIEGYSVRTETTALSAYKYVLQNHIDLIITNIQLQKVTGLHLIKKLRSKPITTTIPILLLAKKSILNEKVLKRIEEYKVAYLTLPLSKPKLVAEVKLAINKDELPAPEEQIVFEMSGLGVEENNFDTSKLDTDKFNKRDLQKDILEQSIFKNNEKANLNISALDSSAASALAEITQQAEQNLSNIVASERSSPIIKATGTTNYLGWWGFHIRPFSNTPDSRFYFNSKQHSEAITRLMYAVENMEGLAVLIGKIGAGKTTLARRMLERFDPNEYVVALLVIIHSAINADWLLRKIALQLGVQRMETEKLLLIGQLYKRLVEIYEEGKKAVILIDEAQMLQTRELMEEFRGLLNLEVPGKKLLTFVFFGLEELNTYLALDEPLKQRMALKYNLHPFDRPATRAYILHRLKVSGVETPIFSEDAVNLIFETSEGTPRIINTICNNALLEGFFLKKRYIDRSLVRKVSDNLGFKKQD